MASRESEQATEAPPADQERWAEALDLPCSLSVELEIPCFTVRDLLSLEVNSVVDTLRREGSHVPVRLNGRMVGWAEFDVVDDRLAVRLTELV